MIEQGDKYRSYINAEPVAAETSTVQHPNGVVIHFASTYDEYENMCTEIGETVRWSLVDTETDQVKQEHLALVDTVLFDVSTNKPFVTIITLKFIW